MPHGRGNVPSKSGKETWDRHTRKKRKHQHYKKRNKNYSSGINSDTFAAHSMNHHYDADKYNPSKWQSNTDHNNVQEFIDTVQITKQQHTRLITNKYNTAPKQTHFDSKLQQAVSLDVRNLPIPRKPKWTKNTTKEQLHTMEQETFLNWRRNLAKTIQYVSNSNHRIEISPFEKNINVWRQLWITIDKSHLLLIVVDARNPLTFLCRDLLLYIKEVDNNKHYMVIINKADRLTTKQRNEWMAYFDAQHIKAILFSAIKEQIKLNILSKSKREIREHKENKEEHNENILSREELSEIFLNERNQMNLEKIFIGLIGYPNVGKSSIINVLMGEKVVKIGAVPGKTKHFQTLHLKHHIILCDCPGLVFPSLSSRSDMVLDGVIPIDNLRDFFKPMQLMMSRVTVKQLNDTYNLNLDHESKLIGVYDVLDAYCNQKKMFNKSKAPDVNKAARIVLKDYVRGKIVYNHYPPT